MKKNVHVKTGDTVEIITGKYRGHVGKVLDVSHKEGKIIVENAAIIKKHHKPRNMGESGGIVEAESAFYAAKAQVVCPSCKRATRVNNVVNDGKKVRQCIKCKQEGKESFFKLGVK